MFCLKLINRPAVRHKLIYARTNGLCVSGPPTGALSSAWTGHGKYIYTQGIVYTWYLHIYIIIFPGWLLKKLQKYISKIRGDPGVRAPSFRPPPAGPKNRLIMEPQNQTHTWRIFIYSKTQRPPRAFCQIQNPAVALL